MTSIQHEIARRRTFAIISHPDAGKTTLTEKLLLFGGCIESAGAVRGRKSQRGATSDWLELEKQRGISVSSTVLTFEFEGHQVNLLDTPGHHDFSEDTYRTLMAADGAVMVLDLAKGIEAQTEKLFRVCAMRRIPVITFVNKVDRPGMGPLQILAEIEEKFGIDAVPQNWPIGSGLDFCGVVNLAEQEAHLFETRDHYHRIPYRKLPLTALDQISELSPEAIRQTLDEVELVHEAGVPYDREKFLAGKLTPVYFGSALTNYGVEHFLRGFLQYSPSPTPRLSDHGLVPTGREDFAGFVFKIQANLDPRHRDRIAFVRICSGRFRRDMEVVHSRTGKKIRLRRAHRVFGQDRETMEEAFPGDIIGLVNPGEFRLGDTICEGEVLNFEALPQFSPENFAIIRCRNTDRRKQFDRGLGQLLEEGAIQAFSELTDDRRDLLLAAVGELQFDVVRFRLESEYDAATSLDWLPFKIALWIDLDPQQAAQLKIPYTAKVVRDQTGHLAVLFHSKWDAEYAKRENPNVEFSSVRTSSVAFPT